MPSQILVKAFQSHTSLKANTAEGQGHVPTQGSPWRKSLPSGSLGFILAVLTVQQRPLGPCWCAHHLGLDSAQEAAAASPRQCFAPFRLIYNQKLIISHSMGFPYFLFWNWCFYVLETEEAEEGRAFPGGAYKEELYSGTDPRGYQAKSTSKLSHLKLQISSESE